MNNTIGTNALGNDVIISTRAQDYLDGDDLNYVGSEGTLISYDEKSSRCKIRFSDNHILTIPSEYVDLCDANESIYEQLNKIDDKESLNEKYNVKDQHELKKLQKSLNEAVRSIEGKYKFKYIADDNVPYLEMGMTEEEIDYAFDNNRFPSKMWLEGEAVITKNKDEDYGTFYEVSWTGDMSDYVECSTIAKCKEAVEKYGMFYKIQWIEDKNIDEAVFLTEAPIGSNDGSKLNTTHDAKVVYETVRHIVDNKDNEEYPNAVTEAINHVRRNLKVDIEKNAAHWGYNNVSIKQLISNYTKAINLIEDNFENVAEQVVQLRALLKQLQDKYNKNKR